VLQIEQEKDHKMATLAQAGRLLDQHIKTRQPVFLWGPPGVGKSDKVREAVSERKGWGLIDFRAVLRDTVAMLGIPDINREKKTTVWFPPDELPQADRDGKKGILFLDELNAAHPQVQAACFGLVLDRKLGDYHLPDGWVIVAAGNRQSDKSAAQRMPRALANRFFHCEVTPDLETWVEDYAIPHDVDSRLIGYLRWQSENFHKMEVDDERMFPTPRSWVELAKQIETPKGDRMECFAGHVGAGAAAAFHGFLDIYEKLPDFDDIIRKPKTTEVPEEVSALYALSTAMGRNADRDNFDAIMIYAERLGREYEVVTCIDATRRDPDLTKTRAYTNFVKRNKDVQIGQFRV
jgi:hypothetical protein